jgi:23S rRNA pseudouridine1911/1915/1917 synthase
LAVARTDAAYKSLVTQLSERRAKRNYAAIVCGHMAKDAGEIDAALGRSKRDRTQVTVDRRGKEALTQYKVAGTAGPCDVLDLTLGTGRTHQIRVHLRHVGKPVLGDSTYGGRGKWATTLTATDRQKVDAALKVLKRQALHAVRLSLAHPRTGQTMSFEAEWPADMKKALEILSR